MEDEKIIDLYFRRSELAIQESADKYGSYCGSIARNILPRREDAEEAVNDTWLGAWRAMPPARPPILRIFLGKITRLTALSKHRDLTRQKRCGSEADLAIDELGDVFTNGESAEDAAVSSELMAAVDRFLSGLPKTERQMFVCRYWYMDPIATIARQFGFGESKVKVTLMRTRRKLAAQLQKEGLL